MPSAQTLYRMKAMQISLNTLWGEAPSTMGMSMNGKKCDTYMSSVSIPRAILELSTFSERKEVHKHACDVQAIKTLTTGQVQDVLSDMSAFTKADNEKGIRKTPAAKARDVLLLPDVFIRT